jgi:hypothetical protein
VVCSLLAVYCHQRISNSECIGTRDNFFTASKTELALSRKGPDATRREVHLRCDEQLWVTFRLVIHSICRTASAAILVAIDSLRLS